MKKPNLGQFSLIFLIILVVLLQVVWASNFRQGDRITYTWSYLSRVGNNQCVSVQLGFSIYYFTGIDDMQKKYIKKNHTYYEGRGRDFIFKDPFRNYLRAVAVVIKRLAIEHGLNDVEVALSFVQSLQYQESPEYQRYAVETLIDRCGDCSDKSILYAGILEALNYEWVFLDFPNHLAVGIWFPCNMPGTFYYYKGKCYYFCETTYEGLYVGECPSEFTDVACEIEHP